MFHGLALCAGIGGIELGLRPYGVRTVCYVERDPAAVGVLRRRMQRRRLDNAPIHGDLREFDGRPWRGVVDLVTAGFPCQPFSHASRGRACAEDLWPDVRRVIEETAAGAAFLENVRPKPIERAAEDLEALGYGVAVERISAACLGAAHERPRWWLLAYSDHAPKPMQRLDAEVARLREAARARWSEHPHRFLGVDDGLSSRVDRLRMIGNAVMPDMAALAWLLLRPSLGRASIR